MEKANKKKIIETRINKKWRKNKRKNGEENERNHEEQNEKNNEERNK